MIKISPPILISLTGSLLRFPHPLFSLNLLLPLIFPLLLFLPPHVIFKLSLLLLSLLLLNGRGCLILGPLLLGGVVVLSCWDVWDRGAYCHFWKGHVRYILGISWWHPETGALIEFTRYVKVQSMTTTCLFIRWGEYIPPLDSFIVSTLSYI